MGRSEEACRWLVHFSADDWWWSNPHSRHHITEEFYKRGYRVLWVNPMGMRFPSVRRSGFLAKVMRKVRSTLKALRRVRHGFYVMSPVYLPVFGRGAGESLNERLVGWQLRAAMRALGATHALCFVTLPTFAPVVRALARRGRWTAVIYYYSDQYDRYREIRDAGPIRAWDAMLREDADGIYCASEEILRNVPQDERQGKVVKVIDHQVDFEHFDFHQVRARPLGIAKPIIGYFGSLTDSNDWGLVEHAATAHPEWQFVFVGRKLISLPDLERKDNVHFLGFVPYEQLPEVAANFDVGIMFWKLTDWIRACSPLKLKEYLALGLPVVSVPIEEVSRKYSEYVEVAADGPAFVQALERAMTRGDRERARTFASAFSWKAAVDGIEADLGLAG